VTETPEFYRDEDFTDNDGTVHGLRCAECKTVFVDGQPISERLDSFFGPTPVVRLICVGCALGSVTL
jgi:hypothetical protein